MLELCQSHTWKASIRWIISCLHFDLEALNMQARFFKKVLAMKDDMKKVTGRAKGGVARAANLTADRRSEIARRAAIAKHSKLKPLVAIRKGNFKDELGIDAECYVLNDEKKTPVISQRGMARVLGFSEGGDRFLRFVTSKTMTQYAGPELLEKIGKPFIFQWVSAGPEQQPPTDIHGHEAAILIDVCKAIARAEADGKLRVTQMEIARQSHIILGASAKAGIQGLVYALAGYRPEVEEVIQAFKEFVRAEAKKYESEFPSELYLEWARLYGHKPQRSWKDMHLTINHVYYPLAKSDGKLLALLREAKNSAGDKNAKLFQFLNLVGARALRFHLGRVYDVAQNSASSGDYELEIAKRFGDQKEFDLV